MTAKNAKNAHHMPMSTMIALMRDKGPMIVWELCKLTDIGRSTLLSRLGAAKSMGLVHISGWVVHPSPRCHELVPQWKEGYGVDEPYPTFEGAPVRAPRLEDDDYEYKPNYGKLRKEVSETINKARNWPRDAFLRMVAQLPSFGPMGTRLA